MVCSLVKTSKGHPFIPLPFPGTFPMVGGVPPPPSGAPPPGGLPPPWMCAPALNALAGMKAGFTACVEVLWIAAPKIFVSRSMGGGLMQIDSAATICAIWATTTPLAFPYSGSWTVATPLSCVLRMFSWSWNPGNHSPGMGVSDCLGMLTSVGLSSGLPASWYLLAGPSSLSLSSCCTSHGEWASMIGGMYLGWLGSIFAHHLSPYLKCSTLPLAHVWYVSFLHLNTNQSLLMNSLGHSPPMPSSKQ